MAFYQNLWFVANCLYISKIPTFYMCLRLDGFSKVFGRNFQILGQVLPNMNFKTKYFLSAFIKINRALQKLSKNLLFPTVSIAERQLLILFG